MDEFIGPEGKIAGGLVFAGAVMFRLLQWVLNTQKPASKADAELLSAVRELASEQKRLTEAIKSFSGEIRASNDKTHSYLIAIQVEAAKRR